MLRSDELNQILQGGMGPGGMSPANARPMGPSMPQYAMGGNPPYSPAPMAMGNAARLPAPPPMPRAMPAPPPGTMGMPTAPSGPMGARPMGGGRSAQDEELLKRLFGLFSGGMMGRYRAPTAAKATTTTTTTGSTGGSNGGGGNTGGGGTGVDSGGGDSGGGDSGRGGNDRILT